MRTILQLCKPLFLHSLSLSSPRRRYRQHPVCSVSFIVTFIVINLWKGQQRPPLDESSDLEDCRCKLVHLLVDVVLLLLGSKGLHLLLDVIRDTMRVFEQVGLVPKNGKKDLVQKKRRDDLDFLCSWTLTHLFHPGTEVVQGIWVDVSICDELGQIKVLRMSTA